MNDDTQFLPTYEATQDWLDAMGIENYFISRELSVDVEGDVNIACSKLTRIPVQFNHVEGIFFCETNELTSLLGSPRIVEGSFHCGDNQLTSLEFAPLYVRKDFNCINNQITSLQFCPENVGRYFYCNHNPGLKDFKFVFDFPSIQNEHERIQSIIKENAYLKALTQNAVSSDSMTTVVNRYKI